MWGTRSGRRLALGALCAGVLLAASEPGGETPAPPLPPVSADPGRALRAAVDALGSGDRGRADALLRAVAERHPLIADHADLLRMRMYVEANDAERAIAEEPRWIDREGPTRARFYALLGEAWRAHGDEERARAAFEFAGSGMRDRGRLAELDLAIAKSYRRSGARERAAERLLEVWTRAADLPQGAAADAQLAELERELGRTLRTARPTRDRADRLFESNHNEAALAAYDSALALGLPRKERVRARQQRAETLFRLRRYAEAIDAFAALPASEEREIQRARAVARAGRVPEGAGALEKLGRERRGPRAVQALYLAAVLWDGEKEPERAHDLLEQVIRRLPSSEYAQSARWSLGWAAYRAGQLDEAVREFDALAKSDRDPVSALRPRYWQIRSLELQGAPGTHELYAELAREFPFTYYGWLALRRTGAPVAAKPPALAPGRKSLLPEQLARPRILLEAGLGAEARDELAQLFGRARGLDDRLSLAELFSDAGDFSSAQRLVVDAYAEELARGPAPEDVELWWHAWPAPYETELQKATRDDGRPSRELVYSIMREESGYRPDVISVSGARGLLQLMPDTATRVARTVGLDAFEPNDLFRPALNIELGSAYLGQLLERFGGNEAAAIGSYNAGPEAVARWQPDGGTPEDVWIEQIPYDQTRGYVKRVLRSLHVYRVLY